MQSYEDLNNFSSTPVDYTSANDYVIAYGNNAGNLSTNEYESNYFQIYKQTPLNTFTLPSKDLLINISFDEYSKIQSVIYIGNNANLKVWNNDPASWTITGIRTVADYNEAFANTYIGINTGETGFFNATFEANDQRGNTRSWVANVNIYTNDLFYSPAAIVFAEDTLASYGNIAIIDDFAFATDYSVSFVAGNVTLGQIKNPNTGAIGNSWSATGNKITLNSQLANVRFVPGADSTTDTDVAVTMIRDYDDKTIIRVIPSRWNGTAHSDYSIPASYSIAEDSNLSMSGISITDIRPDNIDAGITYQITIQSPDTANVLLNYNGNTSATATLSGTKSTVNNILGNATARPKIVAYNDYFGNASLTYTQVQTTNGITQADAVPIALYVSNSQDYSVTTNYIVPVTNATQQRFTYQILDQDINASQYTITFNKVSGIAGNFFVNGSNSGSSTATYTGNLSQVNASNVTFAMNAGNVGNAVANWSLSKTTTANVTTQVASNIALSLNAAVANLATNYGYTTNTATTIFSTSVPKINTDIAGNLTLTVSGASGYFGTTDANAASSFSVVGTASTLNTLLPTIKFWPMGNASGNLSANVVLTGSGTTWINKTLNLVGTTANVPANLQTVLSITSSGTYTPSLAQALYCKADALIIGGGGGSSGTNLGYGPTAGGAGGIRVLNDELIAPGSYSVVIGSGGGVGPSNILNQAFSANGQSGQSTSIFGYAAQGGKGGINYSVSSGPGLVHTFVGGDSGGTQQPGQESPTVYSGSSYSAGPTNIGGGGGSAQNASGPDGGAGYVSSIGTSTRMWARGGYTGSGTPPYMPSPYSGNGGDASRTGQRGIVVIRWKSR